MSKSNKFGDQSNDHPSTLYKVLCWQVLGVSCSSSRLLMRCNIIYPNLTLFLFHNIFKFCGDILKSIILMFRQRVPWSAVACRSRQFVRQVHDWASTSSVDMNAHVAVRQCIDQLRDQLEGERPRFMTVFFGSQHLQEGPLIAKEIYEKTGTEVGGKMEVIGT